MFVCLHFIKSISSFPKPLKKCPNSDSYHPQPHPSTARCHSPPSFPCSHFHLEKNYCYKTIRTRHFKCARSDMNLMWKYSCKNHRCLLPPSPPFPPSLLPLPLRLPMDRLLPLHPPPPPPLRSPQSHAHLHCNPLPLRLPGEKLLLIIKCARSNMIFMWK